MENGGHPDPPGAVDVDLQIVDEQNVGSRDAHLIAGCCVGARVWLGQTDLVRVNDGIEVLGEPVRRSSSRRAPSPELLKMAVRHRGRRVLAKSII